MLSRGTVPGDGAGGRPRRVPGDEQGVGRHRPCLRAHPAVPGAADDRSYSKQHQPALEL